MGAFRIQSVWRRWWPDGPSPFLLVFRVIFFVGRVFGSMEPALDGVVAELQLDNGRLFGLQVYDHHAELAAGWAGIDESGLSVAILRAIPIAAFPRPDAHERIPARAQRILDEAYDPVG